MSFRINHWLVLKFLFGAFSVACLVWVYAVFVWLPKSSAYAALKREVLQSEEVHARVGRVASVGVLPFGFSIAYDGTSLVVEARIRIIGEKRSIEAAGVVVERDGVTKVERVSLSG